MSADLAAEIVAHARAGTLLDAIFNQYGRHWFKDDDPTIAALAEQHIPRFTMTSARSSSTRASEPKPIEKPKQKAARFFRCSASGCRR